jgi:hypothetical protein
MPRFCLLTEVRRARRLRARQQQREMLKFWEWCAVAFTQVVTVLPNNLHETDKPRISTGAYWPFLADVECGPAHARDPRVHGSAPHGDGAAHARAHTRPGHRQGCTSSTGSGAGLPRTSCGKTCWTCSGASKPISIRQRPRPRVAWEASQTPLRHGHRANGTARTRRTRTPARV